MPVPSTPHIQDAVIVHGPHGCGKTKNAKALATRFGKSIIIDDWTPGVPLSQAALALTSIEGPCRVHGAVFLPFHKAMSYLTSASPVQPAAKATPLLCKDCEYFSEAKGVRGVCKNSATQHINLVTGPEEVTCLRARLAGACGKAATLFSPRNVSVNELSNSFRDVL